MLAEVRRVLSVAGRASAVPRDGRRAVPLPREVSFWAVHDPQETLAVHCGNGFDA